MKQETAISQVISPAFFDVHRAVRAESYTHYWLKGGRASLKSSFVSIEIAYGIMADPEANAIIYRKVAEYMEQDVYAQMLWALDTLGVSRFWRASKSPLKLTYIPTGGQVFFRGADKAGKSKGVKLKKGFFKFLWFVECDEFAGMDEIETITRSVIRGSTRHTSVFYTYNPPKSMNNWVNAEALVQRPDRLVHHSTYLDAPKEWLGEQFIAEAEIVKQTNPMKYRWAYLGEATGTGGNVFANVVLRPLSAEEKACFDKPYRGLDFGFAVDPCAYTVCAYNGAKRALYIGYEYYAAGASFETLAAEIKKENEHGGAVTADSAEPRSIAELRSRGIRVAGAKKGPGSVEHGMKWLQDLEEIVIDPAQCPNAAREFAGYEYQQDKAGNFRADYPDRDNHAIDSVRYAMEDVIGRRQPAKVLNRYAMGIY